MTSPKVIAPVSASFQQWTLMSRCFFNTHWTVSQSPIPVSLNLNSLHTPSHSVQPPPGFLFLSPPHHRPTMAIICPGSPGASQPVSHGDSPHSSLIQAANASFKNINLIISLLYSKLINGLSLWLGQNTTFLIWTTRPPGWGPCLPPTFSASTGATWVSVPPTREASSYPRSCVWGIPPGMFPTILPGKSLLIV